MEEPLLQRQLLMLSYKAVALNNTIAQAEGDTAMHRVVDNLANLVAEKRDLNGMRAALMTASHTGGGPPAACGQDGSCVIPPHNVSCLVTAGPLPLLLQPPRSIASPPPPPRLPGLVDLACGQDAGRGRSDPPPPQNAPSVHSSSSRSSRAPAPAALHQRFPGSPSPGRQLPL